jgi:hypothetical protein
MDKRVIDARPVFGVFVANVLVNSLSLDPDDVFHFVSFPWNGMAENEASLAQFCPLICECLQPRNIPQACRESETLPDSP